MPHCKHIIKKMIQEAITQYLQKNKQEVILPKAVLFDMDGVLYDSMRFHARAWHEVATKHHLLSSPDDFYMFEGQTGNSTINALYQRTFQRDATEEEKQTIYRQKSSLFNKYNDGEPMPGAADVLKQARTSGLQTLVVTGSGQHSLLNKLNHTYPGCFTREKMVTAFDVKYGKPHPEPYLMGLQKAGVKANEAFVIENAPMGIKAAVAAGIFTIAVNTGPLPDSVLLDEGANLLYPDMKSLADDWKNIMDICSATK
ncbi:haloacid dehalogenase superfamily, subfamily IA, variant 3 with third motif having DD or ED [Parabacteroides chinchillae]|uniref:Haloacid dehalogenase superfamily, subfamily IA, variant 3 with third motif having DD or ED n=2 Tax=Parabacteroides chinchillae TaxID=871327 RepID=A0A8G2BXJ9_9BACT|nr:haloacid dehalogenase superfamily, subfamily IA, variant 3 with third motif having DD or ED [Parabacteroides chinchillae]